MDDRSDDSTSESEDEDAQELTRDVELEFFKTLSMLKSKDIKIYDKENTKFFENMARGESDDDEGESKKKAMKINNDKKALKKKPYQLKDSVRL